MKVLKILAVALAVLAAVFFLGAHALPDRVQVERNIDILRPPAQVFAVLNDLRRFNEYSPWHGLDPDARYRFEGPDSGPGATLHWSGNREVGSGTLRIVASEAPHRVATTVAFEGFAQPAEATFAIAPLDGEASRVSWQFATRLDGPLMRWFGLMMPGAIGDDYARGLARLKQLVESQPEVDLGGLVVEEIDLPVLTVIALPGSAPTADLAATSATLGALYAELIDFAAARQMEIAGPPMTLTESPGGETWSFLAALPVRTDVAATTGGMAELMRTGSGRALATEHVGPYAGLHDTVRRIDAWAQLHGHRRAGPVQAIYVSDPGDTPEAELRTRLLYPIVAD